MHAISWFEIPTVNLERAERFYVTLLGKPMRREVGGGPLMSIFSYDEPGVGGALIHDPKREPASAGVLVYLSTADLDGAVMRAPAAGGSVVMPRTSIGENGFIALVRDTEGNVVGLHTER